MPNSSPRPRSSSGTPRRLRRAPLVPCGLALLAACADPGREREITESRVYDPVGADIRWNASTAERLRLSMPGMPGARSAPGAPGAPGSASSPVHWDTPPGWVEAETSSLRQANFLVAGAEDAECYLTILGGDGGGLVANVNRWLAQMSLEPMTEEEVAALPRAPLLGREGPLVDVVGRFGGMGGEPSAEEFRLVGIATVGDGSAAFLKMVGPADVVASELDAFRALAASFHDAGSHDHGDAAESTTAGAPADVAMGATTGHGSGGLAWDAPASWVQGPPRAMREVTFAVGDPPAECYVAVLGGTGGGVLSNVNRWRAQVGEAPLMDADSLERLPMLGREGVLMEAGGSFEGMSGEEVEGALLLGAIVLLPDRAVFVKMVGPRESVAPEREAFRSFCGSLRVE